MHEECARILRQGILFGLLGSGTGHAGVDDMIAECAGYDVKDDRIACLERALRAMSNDGSTLAPSADGSDSRPRPGGEAELSAAVPDRLSSGAEEQGNGEPDNMAVIEPAPAKNAPGSHIESLGSEQVARRSEAHDRRQETPVNATVVAFDFVGYERLLVELDNGQVWRQTDGDRANVTRDLRNEKSFDVELRRTGLGGYRMRIAQLDRTIRVERLK